MLSKELDDKITDVSPMYEKSTLGGHFEVTFGLDNVFKLNFTAFLKNRFELDEKLKSYVRDRDTDEISASSIVRDLYSIGCPMDQWVNEYFVDVRSRVSQFDALLHLFNHLKNFGDEGYGKEGSGDKL
jgi:hypothetical protein